MFSNSYDFKPHFPKCPLQYVYHSSPPSPKFTLIRRSSLRSLIFFILKSFINPQSFFSRAIRAAAHEYHIPCHKMCFVCYVSHIAKSETSFGVDTNLFLLTSPFMRLSSHRFYLLNSISSSWSSFIAIVGLLSYVILNC